MAPLSQLTTALAAPFSPRRATKITWLWAAMYALSAACLFGGLIWLAHAYGPKLRQTLIAYLFPKDWHFAANTLVDLLLEQQKRHLLINLGNGASLVLVSALLFPLKELLSARFEQHSQLCQEPPNELPLWQQGLEELKLALLYVALALSIFWLGYGPEPSRQRLAMGLSTTLLAVTFAIDFISPLLQRHGLTYAQILKTLGRRPLLALLFGGVFASPSLLAGLWLRHNPQAELPQGLLVLFSANLVGIVWAVLSGTWVASKLLGDAKQSAASKPGVRVLGWLVLLLVLSANSAVFVALGRSLHHKRTILHCRYSVDWRSIDVDLPQLSSDSWRDRLSAVVGAVRDDTVKVDLKLTLSISNPTQSDARIEDNRIEIRHGADLVSRASISPVHVPAGQQIKQAVKLGLQLHPSTVLKWKELLKNKWRVTLHLRLAPRLWFPVYLLSPQKSH